MVDHFLSDFITHGRVTGFPVLGIKWQRMESASLRAAYGMPPGAKGVLVRSVAPTAAAASVLRADDIVTHFDGVPVANDGTVPFRTGERIAFAFLISKKFAGDTARLRIIRGGGGGGGAGGGGEAEAEKKKNAEQPASAASTTTNKPSTIAETLDLVATLSPPDSLVPTHLDGRDPSYLVVAGLVFTCCSEPYLASEYGGDYISDSPVKLLDRLLHGQKAAADEEVVVLSQVLASDATLGYEDLFNCQVHRFNGEKVRNLRHLASLVDACCAEARRRGEEEEEESGESLASAAAAAASSSSSATTPTSSEKKREDNNKKKHWMRFDLEYGEVVILDAGRAEAATADILAQHSIPAAASPDLLRGGNSGSSSTGGSAPNGGGNSSSSSSSSSSSPITLAPEMAPSVGATASASAGSGDSAAGAGASTA